MRTSAHSTRTRERGFTMVELLVAAMIMAIGLLGLASLQVMSIRTAGVSTRMADAVRLGELVLEAAASEGLQSSLGARYQDTIKNAPIWLGTDTRIDYWGYLPATGTAGEKGTLVKLADANGAVFTVNTKNELVSTFARGSMSKFTVQVTFIEGVVGGASIQRKVQLFREVAHA
ncbi:MAG TPA: prepilin-type N-terminal cleavage/methylation domain-containing protein [Holophagaceae bacterium]|nr:prepilin-type N-terminal cleavage/methylation domain-containing protein [Holophagaceae bacterium]